MLDRIRRDVWETFANDPERLVHIKGVVATALLLARKMRIDRRRILIAAYLHDITKNISEKAHKALIREYYPEEALSDLTPPLYHALSAAAYVRKFYGIDDAETLRAIGSHTIGRPRMTPLEKVLFLADYIEPNRPYPIAREVRAIAFEDIDKAVFTAIDHSIRHFEKEDGHIPKAAYAVRDYYAAKGACHG